MINYRTGLSSKGWFNCNPSLKSVSPLCRHLNDGQQLLGVFLVPGTIDIDGPGSVGDFPPFLDYCRGKSGLIRCYYDAVFLLHELFLQNVDARVPTPFYESCLLPQSAAFWLRLPVSAFLPPTSSKIHR